jgi:hypothetical protein
MKMDADTKVEIQLILVMTQLLIGMASAGQVNETLGPYKVSFSLPADVDIPWLGISHTNVVANTSVLHSETFDGMEYTAYKFYLHAPANNRSVVVLWIFEYNETVNLNQSNFWGYELGGTPYARIVDNHPGILVTGIPVVGTNVPPHTTVFEWEYYLDNHTHIQGMSAMPWDEGTRQLLKTIHIEKLPKTGSS